MTMCSCILGSEGETASCSKTVHPVARKAHICCECERQIEVGEQYQKVSGIWDGEPETYKTCSECAEIRDTLLCDSWCFGTLWEDVGEAMPYIPWSAIAKLSKGARDLVCDQIELWWDA